MTDQLSGLDIVGYRREPGVDPSNNFDEYRSTMLRGPKNPLVPLQHGLGEITGPMFGEGRVGEFDHDLTRQHDGEPIGERIVVHGRLLDGDGKPIRNHLIEIWQANACGRYLHKEDQHDAPLDPNFTGAGRCMTDNEGRYRFITIKPGAYPWGNHYNAWRPQHIHFSLLGRAFAQRLVTQMYFPGDPLFPYDPIFNSIPDEKVRERLICRFDIEQTVPDWALAYEWDIVLRGREATPIEDAAEHDD
jgi:protocatechuate 3,4-dioxygenase, beta subunit